MPRRHLVVVVRPTPILPLGGFIVAAAASSAEEKNRGRADDDDEMAPHDVVVAPTPYRWDNRGVDRPRVDAGIPEDRRASRSMVFRFV